MLERVRFHFDPICPWCYQTSRWVRLLEDLGEVELSWGLFSLELVNEGNAEASAKGHARSAPALRTARLLGERHDRGAVGAFYAAHGKAVHEGGEDVDDLRVIDDALAAAGYDPATRVAALDDPGTWERVRAEHEELVERTRSFGVPTIALDDGAGPAIFGPVISEVPDAETAVELFRHVAWLARYENFSELKRERTVDPPLASVRRFRRARA